MSGTRYEEDRYPRKEEADRARLWATSVDGPGRKATRSHGILTSMLGLTFGSVIPPSQARFAPVVMFKNMTESSLCRVANVLYQRTIWAKEGAFQDTLRVPHIQDSGIKLCLIISHSSHRAIQ